MKAIMKVRNIGNREIFVEIERERKIKSLELFLVKVSVMKAWR